MQVLRRPSPTISCSVGHDASRWGGGGAGTAFLFNAVGIQHSALLQRQMRFTAMAAISVVSLMVGAAIAIGGAAIGYGYWALIANSVTTQLCRQIRPLLGDGLGPCDARAGAPGRGKAGSGVCGESWRAA